MLKLDKTGNADAGQQLAKIEAAINDGAGAGVNVSDLTVATANATVGADATTAATLANDLKVKFNLLISRLAAAQAAAD